MSNSTQQTQDTKSNLSETDTKQQLRAKKKSPKIKEVEATVHHDGGITYTDESGEEKPYVVDSPEDFRWALGEAQMMGKKAFEVSHRLFGMLTMGKPTPYLIQGNPAVFIYPEGTMIRHQTMDTLSVEDLIELKAKKQQKIAAEEKAKKEAFKEDLLKKVE